ncbi:hypothetical protein ACOMHN_065050 [Nucella lapillus]
MMRIINGTAGSLCLTVCFSATSAQIHLTVSSPHYTPMHYVLMVASVVLLLSLLLGILLLARKHCGGCGSGTSQRTRRPLTTTVRPQSSSVNSTVDNLLMTHGDLIIEDLSDENLSVGGCKRSSVT